MEHKFGEKARGAHDFLRMMSDCIAQTLFTSSRGKGYIVKQPNFLILMKTFVLNVFVRLVCGYKWLVSVCKGVAWKSRCNTAKQLKWKSCQRKDTLN